jgi:hypothetical protein
MSARRTALVGAAVVLAVAGGWAGGRAAVLAVRPPPAPAPAVTRSTDFAEAVYDSATVEVNSAFSPGARAALNRAGAPGGPGWWCCCAAATP